MPLGTLVRDAETDEILADLTQEGQRFEGAAGGRGGRGNARFATSTNRAPRFAERGEPGDEASYVLELKLIAEVGLVGLPNAGKSTLLSHISAARPKVDAYPFTTLTPHLGVVTLPGLRTLTVADIPGIIEGAAEGKGLGHDFLRHIERTKVLLFLVDLGDEDPSDTLSVLGNELKSHSPAFEKRPKVVAFNKADIPENRSRFETLVQATPARFSFRAPRVTDCRDCLNGCGSWWSGVRLEDEAEEVPEEPQRDYSYEAPFTIERTPSGFRIEGKTVLRAVRMTDFENEQAVEHLHMTLRRMGLFRALKRMGAKEGQTAAIGDIELEYRSDE